MPTPKGTRFRWKKMNDGRMIRLAFAPNSDRVIEVKKKGGKARRVD
jgi:hypothetical protein